MSDYKCIMINHDTSTRYILKFDICTEKFVEVKETILSYFFYFNNTISSKEFEEYALKNHKKMWKEKESFSSIRCPRTGTVLTPIEYGKDKVIKYNIDGENEMWRTDIFCIDTRYWGVTRTIDDPLQYEFDHYNDHRYNTKILYHMRCLAEEDE